MYSKEELKAVSICLDTLCEECDYWDGICRMNVTNQGLATQCLAEMEAREAAERRAEIAEKALVRACEYYNDLNSDGSVITPREMIEESEELLEEAGE